MSRSAPRRDASPDPGPASRPVLDPSRWLADHGDYLYTYAMMHVRDVHAAEEIVQETLLGAWSTRDRFRGEAAERTWLTGILRFKIVDHLRAAAVQRKREGTLEAEPGDQGPRRDVADAIFDAKGIWRRAPAAWEGPRGADPRRWVEDREFWPIFAGCLERLKPRAAEAFCLREISGLSAREIGETIDASETAVWQMLHRARLALRACLEAKWIRAGEADEAEASGGGIGR